MLKGIFVEILLATSNVHKTNEVQRLLNRPVRQITLDLPEIQAVDVHAVIEQKARAAYALVGKPVLVEDTSLAFHAWNGLPGALIRWFLDGVGNEGICKMLAQFADRTATAETCLGYVDGENFHLFSGAIVGQIAHAPRGENGFGWDALFIPDGWTKTFAEMTLDEKGLISMRGLAVQKLRAYLEEER